MNLENRLQVVYQLASSGESHLCLLKMAFQVRFHTYPLLLWVLGIQIGPLAYMLSVLMTAFPNLSLFLHFQLL